MEDKAYQDLKLKATLMPEATRWREMPVVDHWQKLQRVEAEAHDRVARAYAALDAINADGNLSEQGKADACRKLAEKAVADFRKSDTLERARASVSSIQERWSKKVDESIIAPADHGMAVTYAQIRDRVATMDVQSRLAFIDKNIGNATVVSAVLLAPAFVSGLSDVEINVIRQKLARRTLAPEIAEQQDLVAKALVVAERGWPRACSLIEEKAGLRPPKARAA